MADSPFSDGLFNVGLPAVPLNGILQEVPGAYGALLIVCLVGHVGLNLVGLEEDLCAFRRSSIDDTPQNLPIVLDFRANDEQNVATCGSDGPLGSWSTFKV